MATKLSQFLAELKRRKVYRVATVYVVVGAGIIGLCEAALPPDMWQGLQIPVGVVILIGLPIALVLAWAFEVAPEGRTTGVEAEAGHVAPEDAEQQGPRESLVPEPDVLSLPKGPVIAVLPFTNLSGNPGDEFFTDGITEDIITGLSRFTNLFVIARHSTSRFKGQAVDIREVGREFGARYVLEGGIRRSASQLRVSSQLIDASTGTHLWAETYDRELTTGEIFAVQDDITNRVVATLAAAEGVLTRSGASRLKEKPTDSLRAYEAVLRAFSYWDRQTPSEHLEVREALERGVELDPMYGPAWACLALTYLDEFRVGFNPRPGSMERAVEAARKGVELDPAGHLSHHALAQVHFYRGDRDAFFSAAQRAVRLNPNDCTTVAMTGLLTAYAGVWESGIAMLEKAMALNPYHPGWYYFPLAFDHYRKGDFELALVEALKVNMPGYHPNHITLAAIYGQLGREKEAHAAVEDLLNLVPNYAALAREELGKWFLTAEMLEHVLQGLRQAGLEIPDA